MRGTKAKLLRKLANQVATNYDLTQFPRRKWDILSARGIYQRFKKMYKRTENKEKLNKMNVIDFERE